MARTLIKPTGRPKGAVNLVGKNVKLILIDAFERLGGLDGFVKWGGENRGEFYKLWAKIIPSHKGEEDKNGGVTIQIMQFGKAHDIRTIDQSPEVQASITVLSGEIAEHTASENAENIFDAQED